MLQRIPFGIVMTLLLCCSCSQKANNNLDYRYPSKAYLSLLSQFPEDNQGKGLEPYYFSGIKDQPMTYGLVLLAETHRSHYYPDDENSRRIRKAVSWLLDNIDLDEDGLPGWGLPDEWDAFGDGSINKANQPYTITTAIVLMGLLDALSISRLWTNSEAESIRNAVIETSIRWCKEVYTETESGGFFWYSPNPVDRYFVPNASAMFIGALTRLIYEQRKYLNIKDLQLIEGRIENAVKGIIQKSILRKGAPFWNYIAIPNQLNQDEPNNLVHHAYILFGMEIYRSYCGKIELPWTKEQTMQSLDRFIKEGLIYDYPQDVVYAGGQESYNYRPAILWGTGMMLAFYSQMGDSLRAETILNKIYTHYGPFPNIRLWPDYYSKDKNFYPRFAAHVLFGLALRDLLSIKK